jgi:DNA-binding NtrC family response regulator
VATGVEARTGKLVLASGGTLFLDEIADMPLELQPKLLRALETGEVTPVGAVAIVPVDVRIVSATHRDLDKQVKAGAFREDLLYRLQGAVVEVPPLRRRREEILPLARHFARMAARDQGRVIEGISPRAARCLLGYRWPGNIRELRNAMARAVALAEGAILDVDALPRSLVESADERLGDAMLGLQDEYRTARTRFEALYFSQLLERCSGNFTEAARVAGMSRSNLYRKLEELGLR